MSYSNRVVGAVPVLLAGVVILSAAAWAQDQQDPQRQGAAPAQVSSTKTNSVPDAQLEANILKALTAAPQLANQPITTTTTFGVVTLSGSVQTEAQRTQAENIAARTAGVKKVVDELTLGTSTTGAAAQPGAAALPGSAESADQAGAPQPGPDSDNTGQPPQSASMSAGPSYGPGAPEYRQPYGAAQQQGYPAQQPYGQPNYPQQQAPGYPPQQAPGYSQQQPYGPPPPSSGYGPQQTQQGYSGPQQRANYGGQVAGEMVTIPSGTVVRVRINQSLDSGRTQPGTTFDGVVVNDVIADGAVAIPRGATVQGTVVNAKRSGALAGRGEMSLQLTQVILGGRAYPLVSDVWAHNGGDKTIQTVNSTAVGTGLGALFGAAAGGGVGAAIGAGVGGALGLGASAASGSGQVYIPREGLLTFHVTQPVTVATLSQEEMDRISRGVPANAGAAPPLRRRYYAPYPYPYYGPIYYRPYPGYYRYPY